MLLALPLAEWSIGGSLNGTVSLGQLPSLPDSQA